MQGEDTVQRKSCAKKDKIKKIERRKDRKTEGKNMRCREKIQVLRSRRAKKKKYKRKKEEKIGKQKERR